MADFSALKTAIQANIRTNGNEEITGAILQEILLSMVTTMGDGAINDLAEALQAEITNRQNAVGGEATSRAEADSQLSGRINAEAQARGEADTQLSNSITAITTRLNEGYVYAGIATPSTNPGTPAGKVFYIALQAGTYTNFSSLTVTQGITILKYNGTAWSQDQLVGIDDEPTSGSNNLVKSGGVDKAIFDKSNVVGIVENEYNQRIEYNDALEVGTRENGVNVPVTSRVRSSVFYPIVGDKMRLAFPNDTYRIQLDFYSAASEESYISAIGYITTDQFVNIPTNAKYVRLLFSPKSGVTIDYTSVGLPTDINIGVFIHSLETLSLFNKEKADIQNVNDSILGVKNEFISYSIIKGKYLNTYGTLVDNALYCVTDFIELPSNCASIQWNVGVQPSDDIQLCGYNADKEKTNYWGIANVGTQRAINFTAGTYKYIRASFVLQKIDVAYIKDNTNNVNIYEPFKNAVDELYNKKNDSGLSAIINLRLLSYNVRWLRGGAQDAGTAALTSEEKAQTMADFKDLFQKIKPDVFVCCENRKNFDDARVNGSFVEGSDSVYDGLYKHYFPYHTTLNDGYIPVIYSKYPIIESGDVPITYPSGASEPNRKPPYIKISVLEKDVYIIGAHPKSDASAYELDRAPYFAGIVSFCADKDNVIVAGDFNTDTATPSDELDVFRNAGFELGNFGYFGQFATFRFGTDVFLDNVVTKGVINNNFTVGTEDYSDHYPVECEISV